MDKNMIIGLSGKKESGKSEIAKYLSSKLNLPIFSFALPVKELVTKMSSLTDKDKNNLSFYDGKVISLEPLKNELKENGYDKLTIEEIDSIKAIEYGRICDIYRNLMQYIGTNIFRNRNQFHWINAFAKRTKGLSFIVDDIRFINEYKYILSLKDSMCVRIIRNEDKYKNLDSHVSENELDDVTFKSIFYNSTSSLYTLYTDIDNFFGI